MCGKLLKILICLPLLGLAGCSLVLPEISHKPVIRNPFPQLSRVAIAPFFNQSDESTVDGRDFAMAYYSELQQTPGFEVIPVGVVEEAIIANQINLGGAGEARRLAQILGVDAVVVGAVTDFTPYYPPRCGLRIEWYTANPGYHEILAGYGLPWNTPEEEFIPDSLVYEAEIAQARVQMAKQAPDCSAGCQTLPAPPGMESQLPASASNRTSNENRPRDPFDSGPIALAQATEEVAEELPAGELLAPTSADDSSAEAVTSESITAIPTADATGAFVPSCPDGSCSTPGYPQAARPACEPHHGPVLKHTRVYSATDSDFTQALEDYLYFRTDKRKASWESYLQRSDDFIRFCCHMHISEMLSARGGSRKTQVVWRWPENR